MPAEESALEAARLVLRSNKAPRRRTGGGYDAWRAANGPIQVDAGWEQVFRGRSAEG
jgi:hypothetical protein